MPRETDRRGRRARALALALTTAGALVAAPTAHALTAPATQTFTATGTEQTFVVPAGVTSLRVTAIGGRGGNGSVSAQGGLGARVTADVPVSPGQTLYVEVGANGEADASYDTTTFNGGGPPGAGVYGGGTGGGASDLRTLPRAQGADSLTSRLLVAGGGGGGGGGGPHGGGAAGQPGASGSQNTGGGAGTAQAGGAAGATTNPGSTPATAGTLGTGGSGGNRLGGSAGGGGGGGLWGGGGGGGTGDMAAGSGGGGGSSLVPAGGTVAPDTTGTPSITVEYTVSAVATLSPAGVSFAPAVMNTPRASERVTLTNTGGAGLTVGAASLTGPDAADFAIDSACTGVLAPGASCVVFVRFLPRSPGSRTATLTVAHDGPGGASSLVLAGTATWPYAELGNGERPPMAPEPTPPPQLTDLKLSSARVRAGRSATVTYRLTAPAVVRFTLEQRRAGVRSGSRCVARTKRTRKGAKRCTRTVVARTFTFTDAKAGPQRHTLSLRRVARGRYVLRAVPSSDGRPGTARTTALRVIR